MEEIEAAANIDYPYHDFADVREHVPGEKVNAFQC
jgi:hypothetical protein